MTWPIFAARKTHEAMCEAVFQWCRGRFVWVPDSHTYQAPDYWATEAEIADRMAANGGVLHDDCDGFAVLCRAVLFANGIASRLVLCWVEPSAGGGYHAVCEASGWVLDNRQPYAVPTQDLARIGYVWDRMSGFTAGEPWTDVKREET